MPLVTDNGRNYMEKVAPLESGKCLRKLRLAGAGHIISAAVQATACHEVVLPSVHLMQDCPINTLTNMLMN